MKAPSQTGKQVFATDLRVSVLKNICKSLFLVIAVLILTSCTQFAQAQFLPGTPAKFGIDGQINSTATTHDWFKTTDGNNLSIFDIPADVNKIKDQVAAGKNYVFSRKMSFEPYSIHDGFLMLDGTYSRDYFGNDTTLDKTIFTSDKQNAAQNSADPTTWQLAEKGDVLPSKSDIIDTYIHMRRNGTSIEIGNASPLFVYLGASTLSANGDHFVDFELFKSTAKLDKGGFTNTSLTKNTGGRDPWVFNADGSIQSFGGMSFSFSFSNAKVTDIAIYIWVSYDVFSTVNPKNFDFDIEWNGPKSGFGFARIKPNPGNDLPAWGSTNTTATAAPLWGTNNKELGAQITNYYHTQYSPGQFAEAAIDLSSLGVDPALSTTFDKCNPPYRRVLIKTRSSSSFSSALQDFAGPFEFLDNPVVPVAALMPGTLTCANTQITLQPENNITGASYKWVTTDGNIISGATTATPLINKPGKYELTAALYEGCASKKSSVKVLQDIYKPVASARQVSLLTNEPASSAIIEGGDVAASNYSTEFGGSKGLSWSWSGPNFQATTQNISVKQEGTYQLTVTEARNGCTAEAYVYVERIMGIILPVTLTSFTGIIEEDNVQLNWGVASNEAGNYFELQRSVDGKNFSPAAILFNSPRPGAEKYLHKDALRSSKVYYRLQVVNKDKTYSYSNIIAISKTPAGSNKLQLLQNPVSNNLTFKYHSTEEGYAAINLYTAFGGVLHTQKIRISAGSNTISIPLGNSVKTGSYVLEIKPDNSSNSTAKFIKY